MESTAARLRALVLACGWWLLTSVFLTANVQGAARASAEERPAAALHEQIDALVEAAATGPLPPPADDAEFLRRIWLDLLGTIPTAVEARAFLNDPAADKRAQLIDRLLADPRHARWMATTFDVYLMERRPHKTAKAQAWQEWLYQSFLDDKPYHQLVGELLSADGSDLQQRPAARFFLDRDCEPNLLARDIGRLFFGMDLQCAQCHDHPLVDDYLQSDYYGLYAFVSRSSVFANKTDKNLPTLVADKADGEASFSSVFTGTSVDRFLPRLPKDPAVEEPSFAKGEEYRIKPDKNQRGVPHYSRRLKLAELAAAGENAAFNRNIVNRLWAQMFGRGLIHPIEFQHPDNPPSQPELLELLAGEFRRSNYSIRGFLRELALSRAYQRSCVLPEPADVRVKAVGAKLAEWTKQAATLEQSIAEARAEVAACREAAAAASAAPAAETALLAAERQLADVRTAAKALAVRMADAQAVIDYVDQCQSDPAGAAAAWQAVIDRWTERGQVATLKPLTPEQFSLSLLQATGVLDNQWTAAVAAIEQKPPAELREVTGDERALRMALLVEPKVFAQNQATLAQFVGLYGGEAGQEFQATVNQALFFGNGPTVTNLLAAKSGTLTARLVPVEDAAALADELYLSVLTRQPTPAEAAEVAAFLADRTDDRAIAIGEIVWALLSSNEFRFNH